MVADRPVLDEVKEEAPVGITPEMLEAGLPAKIAPLDEERLLDAVIATLLDHFSDASVDGLIVGERQARLLAFEVLRRYEGRE